MHASYRNPWTYLNQINFVESLVVAGSLDVQDGDNVFVVKVSQQLHLTQCSQTEHGVVEWCDLLDCDLLARGLVNGRANYVRGTLHRDSRYLPNNSVGTFTDDILDFILIGYIEGDLSRSSRRRVLLTHIDWGGVRLRRLRISFDFFQTRA
jgi:hypothetical protein